MAGPSNAWWILLVVAFAFNNIADAASFTCNASFVRSDGGTGTIEHVSIKLGWFAVDITAIPVGGSPEAMARWASITYEQALAEDRSSSDVNIIIDQRLLKDKVFDYGQSATFSNALIMSKNGFSWKIASCQEQMENPNNGFVYLEMTPKSLKGSYSAELLIFCDGKTPIEKGHLSGTFNCAMPILSDSLYPTVDTKAEGMRLAAEGVLFAKNSTLSAMDRRRRSRNDGPTLSAGNGVPGGSGPGLNPSSSGEIPEQCNCTYPGVLMYSVLDSCYRTCEENDTETQKFETDLRQMGLQDNVIASFAYAFQISGPEQRAQLWVGLEKGKAKAAEYIRLQEAMAGTTQAQTLAAYDAETLRYQSDIEQFGLSPEIMAEMVENFQTSNAAARAFLSQQMERMKQQKK